MKQRYQKLCSADLNAHMYLWSIDTFQYQIKSSLFKQGGPVSTRLVSIGALRN